MHFCYINVFAVCSSWIRSSYENAAVQGFVAVWTCCVMDILPIVFLAYYYFAIVTGFLPDDPFFPFPQGMLIIIFNHFLWLFFSSEESLNSERIFVLFIWVTVKHIISSKYFNFWSFKCYQWKGWNKTWK